MPDFFSAKYTKFDFGLGRDTANETHLLAWRIRSYKIIQGHRSRCQLKAHM